MSADRRVLTDEEIAREAGLCWGIPNMGSCRVFARRIEAMVMERMQESMSIKHLWRLQEAVPETGIASGWNVAINIVIDMIAKQKKAIADERLGKSPVAADEAKAVPLVTAQGRDAGGQMGGERLTKQETSEGAKDGMGGGRTAEALDLAGRRAGVANPDSRHPSDPVAQTVDLPHGGLIAKPQAVQDVATDGGRASGGNAQDVERLRERAHAHCPLKGASCEVAACFWAGHTSIDALADAAGRGR